jgi:acetyl esterase/lipase
MMIINVMFKMALLLLLIPLISGCVGGTKQHTHLVPSHMLSVQEFQAISYAAPDHRLAYGASASQFGELRVPTGSGPHPVVVLIHGGCWKQPYASLKELGPLGDALKADGIATWNIEYSRLYESGSGWPGTYQDIGRAVDHLRVMAGEYRLDLNRVVIVGHSAGGHLAMWTGGRSRLSKESQLFAANPLPVRGVINLAGTMDMKDNIENMQAGCQDAVVTSMLGGEPQQVPERYAQASAINLLPLGIPQLLIWGEHEDFIPLPLAQKYVNAATQAGDAVSIIVVPGVGHFDLASPFTASWPLLRSSIKELLYGDPVK